LIKIQFSLLFF